MDIVRWGVIILNEETGSKVMKRMCGNASDINGDIQKQLNVIIVYHSGICKIKS